MTVGQSKLRGVLRVASLAVGAVLLLAVFWVVARIVLYRQVDDSERLVGKREYLARIVATPRPPAEEAINVVLILFDDLGYGDLGSYGADAIETPNLDRIAAAGLRFTSAYAPSPYCSASRAGLLTGRHAIRSGMHHVLQAPGTWQDNLLRLGGRNRRLPKEEITLSEVLSAAGYATGIVGKWHLGDESPSLPNDRGFDRFWGLLYSNDQGEPRVLENGGVVEPHPIDQTTLTRRYTERAVEFLERQAAGPFFLYLPHTFPHIPLHVSSERVGSSAGGLYGDVVEELDESVGTVMSTLERLGVAERTLVIVSSDNGPWFQGSRGPVRGRKFDVFDGGTRVPFLLAGPAGVPGGRVIETPISALDVFPTVLELAGLPLPGDRQIDGVSLAGALREGTEPPSRPIFFQQLGIPRAVRLGRFKYHARHAVFYGNPMDWIWGPMRYRGPWLFDLELDHDESYDVSARHPQEAERLAAMLADWQRELESNPRGWR